MPASDARSWPQIDASHLPDVVRRHARRAGFPSRRRYVTISGVNPQISPALVARADGGMNLLPLLDNRSLAIGPLQRRGPCVSAAQRWRGARGAAWTSS